MPRVYGDEELAYFRELEAERIELSSPECEYYSLNRGKNVDALYGEPTNDPLYGGSSPRGTPSRSGEAWNFYPDIDEGQEPLVIVAAIEYQQMDNREPSTREEGIEWLYDAQIFISRNHWECALEDTAIEGRLPKVGDVIYLFEEWWDVVKAGKGGDVLDTPEYVGFKLDVRKRTKFTPDRKV